jgi:predicted MFS family arabinose efflux permease
MLARLQPAKNHSGGVLEAFQVRNFRFQFGADLLVAWAIEMEVIILAWYILVTTDSAMLVALVGALRFCGTLISPFIGALADRGSRRKLLIGTRGIFALLALVLAGAGIFDALSPLLVFGVVTVAGLLRPVDMMLRQSLIADGVPARILSNAMGFFRTTLDSARLVGALAGAGLMGALGIGNAYLAVTVLYVASVCATSLISEPTRAKPVTPSHPLHDLKAAFRLARTEHQLLFPLLIAFLINLTVLAITGGLLPLVARDTYGLGADGLGFMVAAYACGALIGSVLTATTLRNFRPERLALAFLLIWHALMIGFALVTEPVLGLLMLFALGLSSNLVLVPVSVTLLRDTPPEFRARIMGLRQLAVLGLPLGLMVSGALITRIGLSQTLLLYAVLGLLSSVALWRIWRP